jgi:hypothetical protein
MRASGPAPLTRCWPASTGNYAATKYLQMAGEIVGATSVATPKQRNAAAEKDAIKAGRSVAEIWPENPVSCVHRKKPKGKPIPARARIPQVTLRYLGRSDPLRMSTLQFNHPRFADFELFPGWMGPSFDS